MRRLILTLTLLLFLSPPAFAVDWEYWRDFTLGAITSGLVHEISHGIVINAQGNDFTVHTRSSGLEIQYDGDDNYPAALAGFTGQHAVGTALTSWRPHSAFVKGYNVCSAVSTWTYPLRYSFSSSSGDFRNGRRLEYGIFSTIAFINLYRIEW